MNKKFISVLLCLLLVLSLMGCGKKDPIERLENSFERSLKMDTASQSFAMELFIDSSEDTPELAMFKNILNGMKITGFMDMNQKNMSFSGKMKMDMNGMSYEMELYRGEEYFIKMPFVEKYIIIANKEDAAAMLDTEMIKDYSKDINDLMFSKLNSSNTVANSEITIDQNDGSIKVTPINITFTDEEAKEIFSGIMEFMVNNPEFSEQMKKNMKTEIEASEGEKTEEEIEAMYKEAEKAMDNVFKAINDGISLSKFEAVYYLDKKDDIRRSDIDLIMDIDLAALAASSIPEGSEVEVPAGLNLPVITLQITGSSDIYNINKDLPIEIPEINEENSVGIEGLMGLPVQ